MLLNPPNFLRPRRADEPPRSLHEGLLIDSLTDYDRTMLFVSHDCAFLRALSNRVLELDGERGVEREPHLYPGSYVEYVARTGHEAPGATRKGWQGSPARSFPSASRDSLRPQHASRDLSPSGESYSNGR